MDVRERTRDDFRIVWGVGMWSLRDDLANGGGGKRQQYFVIFSGKYFFLFQRGLLMEMVHRGELNNVEVKRHLAEMRSWDFLPESRPKKPWAL